jgi:hypothetical protein
MVEAWGCSSDRDCDDWWSGALAGEMEKVQVSTGSVFRLAGWAFDLNYFKFSINT